MSKLCKVGVSCKFAIEGIDLEKKSVPVILSDETEVVRYNWSDGKYFLTLMHGVENVDLTRKDILPLFINHNTYDLPIGKFENVRVEDKKLKANAVFDESDDESMKIFNKLSKGFLQSFSVGINIITKELAKEDDGVKYYNVTKWAIDEASVVGIPAIPSAKVGLKEDENSGDNRHQALAKNQNLIKGSVMTEIELQALRDEHAEALTGAGTDAQKLERDRVSGILALKGSDPIKLKSIQDGLSVGDTAIALNESSEAQFKKQKTDFEDAASKLQDNDEAKDDGDDENLSEDDKDWDEAEKLVYGGKE